MQCSVSSPPLLVPLLSVFLLSSSFFSFFLCQPSSFASFSSSSLSFLRSPYFPFWGYPSVSPYQGINFFFVLFVKTLSFVISSSDFRLLTSTHDPFNLDLFSFFRSNDAIKILTFLRFSIRRYDNKQSPTNKKLEKPKSTSPRVHPLRRRCTSSSTQTPSVKFD